MIIKDNEYLMDINVNELQIRENVRDKDWMLMLRQEEEYYRKFIDRLYNGNSILHLDSNKRLKEIFEIDSDTTLNRRQVLLLSLFLIKTINNDWWLHTMKQRGYNYYYVNDIHNDIVENNGVEIMKVA